MLQFIKKFFKKTNKKSVIDNVQLKKDVCDFIKSQPIVKVTDIGPRTDIKLSYKTKKEKCTHCEKEYEVSGIEYYISPICSECSVKFKDILKEKECVVKIK